MCLEADSVLFLFWLGRDAKKLLKKKRKSLGRGRGRGRKNGDRIASGAATSSSLSAAEGRSKPKSEEHRRRISEAMKRKWNGRENAAASQSKVDFHTKAPRGSA